MLFMGHAELTIDAKGRLAIPSKYRSQLRDGVRNEGSGSEEGPAPRWVAVPWPTGLIRLYPEATFERLASSTSESLTPGSDEAELEETLYGLAEHVEPDKAGRVVLPKAQVRMVGLPSEVVVVGVRNRLEVRDRATWAGEIERKFRSLPELVAKRESNQARER